VTPPITIHPKDLPPDSAARGILQDFDLLFEKKGWLHGVSWNLRRHCHKPAAYPMEFENVILRLGAERRGIRREVRTGSAMDLNAARDIGSRLFNAVFQGAVGNRLFACLDEADASKGIRIRLRLGDTPELMDAPQNIMQQRLRRFYAYRSDLRWALPGPA
jgi:hypothetical protein